MTIKIETFQQTQFLTSKTCIWIVLDVEIIFGEKGVVYEQ